MTMIILGGLGHNIVFNFFHYLKTYIVELFGKKIIHKKSGKTKKTLKNNAFF